MDMMNNISKFIRSGDTIRINEILYYLMEAYINSSENSDGCMSIDFSTWSVNPGTKYDIPTILAIADSLHIRYYLEMLIYLYEKKGVKMDGMHRAIEFYFNEMNNVSVVDTRKYIYNDIVSYKKRTLECGIYEIEYIVYLPELDEFFHKIEEKLDNHSGSIDELRNYGEKVKLFVYSLDDAFVTTGLSNVCLYQPKPQFDDGKEFKIIDGAYVSFKEIIDDNSVLNKLESGQHETPGNIAKMVKSVVKNYCDKILKEI